ncbi:hypothetical protein H6P81_018752 [Aristolochia fimbriata]|uniref:Uncharacterized protein n=1 Tax=Aristolochia fimbriata TaxID=158543 RepID=A0AAV7E273_ARIFI|nr:hypothetical protein H6P81_018752 [Aristolochia fimbriata]
MRVKLRFKQTLSLLSLLVLARVVRIQKRRGADHPTQTVAISGCLQDNLSSGKWQLLHIDAWRTLADLAKTNAKRVFLVDTLALVRRLEAQGIPSKQAEVITEAITEVLNNSLETVAQSYIKKGEMQMIEMVQETNISKFKSEVQSSQEHHFSRLKSETEKLRNDMKSETEKMRNNMKTETDKLRNDIEKMRSELRYEVDKVTAGLRLDLNLERGRIRDELANQSGETTSLSSKLDREIHLLRAQLEAAKYEVIKYCIGTLISMGAFGLALVRIWK